MGEHDQINGSLIDRIVKSISLGVFCRVLPLMVFFLLAYFILLGVVCGGETFSVFRARSQEEKASAYESSSLEVHSLEVRGVEKLKTITAPRFVNRRKGVGRQGQPELEESFFDSTFISSEHLSMADASLFGYAQSNEFSLKTEEPLARYTLESTDGDVMMVESPTADIVCSDAVMTANESVWGAFRPGSWIRTRTTGITYEGKKTAHNVTETKSTLVRVDADRVVVRREVVVKMGTVNHVKPAEMIQYDFFGIPLTHNTETTSLAPSTISVARKMIPCQVRKVEQRSEQQREETILWYSSVVKPYVLQRETKMFNQIPGGATNLVYQSRTTCLKTSANVLLGNILITYQTETNITKGNSTSTVNTLHSTRVPGGILKETTVETDMNGVVRYSSETVLLDYFASRW